MNTLTRRPPRKPFTSVGTHYVVELTGCDRERLRWVDDVREVLLRAAHEGSANVVGFTFHQFRPEGASGVLLISESHISIHTWPEHRYMAMDVFTCGEEMDPERVIRVVREGVDADNVRVDAVQRGF